MGVTTTLHRAATTAPPLRPPSSTRGRNARLFANIRTSRRAHRRTVCAAASPSEKNDDLFDAYAILGIAHDAHAGEIRRAYVALQKEFHPDVYNGVDVETRSSDINRAYGILTHPGSRVKLDAGLLRVHGRGIRRGGAILSASGLVGPLRSRFLLRFPVKCGEAVDEACSVDTVLEVTESIREWGKLLAFTSETPLPLPLQCDDINGGLRLAMITFDVAGGRIKEVGALNVTVERTRGDEGGDEGGDETVRGGDDDTYNKRVEVRVCRCWAGDGQEASTPEGEQLPGESRILANFAEEFAFLVDQSDASVDGLSGSRGQRLMRDGRNKRNGGMAGLKGFVSNIVSFALPVLPFFGSTRSAMPGGSYDAYRINRRRNTSSSVDQSDEHQSSVDQADEAV